MAAVSLTLLCNMLQFEDKHHSGLLKMIADQLQCSPADIVDFELNVCDTQDGVIGGMAFMFKPFSCCPAMSCIYTYASWPYISACNMLMFVCGVCTLAMHALRHSCWQLVAAVFALNMLKALGNAAAVKACSLHVVCFGVLTRRS